jgi:hypothetical protein
MKRNGKEKRKEPWTVLSILGVAAAGVAAVAAGTFFVLSMIGDIAGQDQTAAADDDDAPARPGRMMKGPGAGGAIINRARFEEDPQSFFRTGREKGTAAAVKAFK